MFNGKVLKKMMKEYKASKDLDSMSKYAVEKMKPEKEEDEDEMEEMEKKGKMRPEAKIELEIMLNSAKKKKG